ncbi:hypothetical protein MtrunA17_Chr3g0093851 [Medicago truncatula]|uniref:Transmembrane protein n=1 Tax=Medicago truncatula TaxID=3880 RepID=A0A396IPK3_MEDTR|nr:hypothetical protein MtrunA17_Chr3g0093851 [Medicago truncatula]
MLRLGTRVVMDDSFLIHKYGLTSLRSDEIKRPRFDPARLVGICFVFVVWLVLSVGRLRVGVNQRPMMVAIPDQFQINRIYPSKTIYDLIRSPETGLFVVSGRIVGYFQVDQWWFSMCDCGNCMKVRDGLY